MTAKTDCPQRPLGWGSEFSDLQGRLAVSLPNHVDIYQTRKWGGEKRSTKCSSSNLQKTKKGTRREMSSSFLLSLPCCDQYYFWTTTLWVLASNVCSFWTELQGRLDQDQDNPGSRLLPTRGEQRCPVSKSLFPILENRAIISTWKLASKAASLLFSSYWGLSRGYLYFFFFLRLRGIK